MVGEDATTWIAIAALEAEPDTYGKEALMQVIDWRKRSKPPKIRLHQARKQRVSTREAPQVGAFFFGRLPQAGVSGFGRSINRSLYRGITHPHRLSNARHCLPLFVQV